jgi:hypothetical protein
MRSCFKKVYILFININFYLYFKKVLKAQISKPKFIQISKSKRDLLNTELADNLDDNANCKLTNYKLVHNSNVY